MWARRMKTGKRRLGSVSKLDAGKVAGGFPSRVKHVEAALF